MSSNVLMRKGLQSNKLLTLTYCLSICNTNYKVFLSKSLNNLQYSKISCTVPNLMIKSMVVLIITVCRSRKKNKTFLLNINSNSNPNLSNHVDFAYNDSQFQVFPIYEPQMACSFKNTRYNHCKSLNVVPHKRILINELITLTVLV